MKILLDTHIALWAISDDEKIPLNFIKIINNPENEIFYSLVSVWEVAIKHYVKPEIMPITEEQFIDNCYKSGFKQLAIRSNHILNIKSLKRNNDAPKHNDPFDRLLISQAKTDSFLFLTHDSLLADYNESCIMFN
ncbi:MAG: type II toxin-antitoxin system VapC family toxin [Candidatus Riflebacteria bacterium]|nr:type II toxin-antitoxin system VapC family toxin [Candidatus Riflebacteria bacterium]